MEHTFQKAKLNEAEKLWLCEVHQSKDFDVKKTKVKLYGKIPKNFDVRKIDQRLYRHDHLTLIGIRLIDPNNEIFDIVAAVISEIKDMILKSPGIDGVSAVELAKNTGLQEQDIEVALRLMADLGSFTGGSTYSSNNRGYSSIAFSSGDDGYDAYLSYENLDELMEQFYAPKPPKFTGVAVPNWFSQSSIVGGIANDEVKQKPNTAFVIMSINPANPELEDVYNAIKDICEKFGISSLRADIIEHQESITDVILRQIRECEFLIADLSYERPNVYYEVGYAHALGKRPILFRKVGTNLHFDLAGFGCPEYQNVTALKTKLDKRFKAILGKETE